MGPRPRLLEIDSTPCPTTWSWRRVGAGILWLGWNGFNGGDPYYAGASAAAAVVNTNLATAVGVLVWMALDAWLSKEKKPTFLGGVNGMICGLVGITPCAGWVNGWGAIMVGAICTVIVWVAWNYLSKVRPFSKVDDALGVIYTHGIAGFFGGLFLGLFGDPNMIEYGCGHLNSAGQVVNTLGAGLRHGQGICVPFGVSGLMYTGSAHQLWEQFRAAIWVIFWSALVTFILMKLIGLVLRGAPLQGRDPRSRRPGHPRRGSLPGGDLRHPLRRSIRSGRHRFGSASDSVGSIAPARCRGLGLPGRKELNHETDSGSPQAVQAR